MLFGGEVQARAHLVAKRAVRPIDEVRVVGRTPANAASLVEEASAAGLEADVARADTVADADIICTCTTAIQHFFGGSLLGPGVHINAVGAHGARATELDGETIRRGRLVVETWGAMSEAGDLLALIEGGEIEARHTIADLAELVGGKPVRTAPEDVTIFKNVGVAYEDLVIAQAAFRRLGEDPG